jgi:hypothetical protein
MEVFFVLHLMRGKYYGDGSGDETWIELAQDRVQCSLVLIVSKSLDLLP